MAPSSTRPQANNTAENHLSSNSDSGSRTPSPLSDMNHLRTIAAIQHGPPPPPILAPIPLPDANNCTLNTQLSFDWMTSIQDVESALRLHSDRDQPATFPPTSVLTLRVIGAFYSGRLLVQNPRIGGVSIGDVMDCIQAAVSANGHNTAGLLWRGMSQSQSEVDVWVVRLI